MNLHVDAERVAHAFGTIRNELLAERTVGGHWVGEIGNSPSATAAAISALVVAHAGRTESLPGDVISPGTGPNCDQLVDSNLSDLIVEGLLWLAERQNSDGGWGDTERGRSNVAATLLVQSAFRLTCVPAKHEDLTDRADEYVEANGGIAGFRKRFGRDKSLTAPVLANAALAGMLTWRQVPALPLALACLPPRWFGRLRLPVASHALPLLIAVGLLKFHHDPPRNPLRRLVRVAARKHSLAVLERMQADDGSFLESTLTTSFVVMSLASIGLDNHAIVERGVEFLLATVRSDATWATDVNLNTLNTARAIHLLADGGSDEPSGRPAEDRPLTASWMETVRAYDTLAAGNSHLHLKLHTGDAEMEAELLDEKCIDWLLDAQRFEPNTTTDAESGGWSWTDAAGAAPDADSTAQVLATLAAWRERYPRLKQHRLLLAARRGVEWLLALQNSDGGWPSLCRGWSVSTSDNSATDLTAHAIGALFAWRRIWSSERQNIDLQSQIESAIMRGVNFLEQMQRNDGSFVPLAFGNQYHADGYNLVYGTAEVLKLAADLGRLDSEMAQRAARWVLGVQHANGGWGPQRSSPATTASNVYRSGSSRAEDALANLCTVEETALAIAALLPLAGSNQLYARAVQNGLKWLVDAVEQGRHKQPAPVGLRFGKVWHAERLFPLVFAARALKLAVRQLTPHRPVIAPVA